VHNNFEIIWKEAVVTQLDIIPVRMQERRKTCQNSQCLSQDPKC